MRLMSACAGLVLLLSTQGCYSVSSFQSESAAIHDGGYFTDYQYFIMFDPLEIQRSAESEYAFSGAPSRRFVSVLQFEQMDDLELLIAHSAVASVTVTDEGGTIVYDFTGNLTSAFAESKPLDTSPRGQWNFRLFGGFDPPPDWQWNKTRVSVNPSRVGLHLDRRRYHI